ncbi:MAG: hypothetical protein DWG76_01535 [Chloroflexi bacterium]|nr:hypothetical protein [Chloroflexota bacterium]
MMTNKLAILIGFALAVSFFLIISYPGGSGLAESSSELSLAINTTDSNIVYFTTANENSGDLLSPANVQQTLNATVATTWSEVLDLNKRYSLDALILGEDIISEVNREELTQMYQDAVIIAVFNTYAPTLAQLVSDECIGKDGWMDGNDPYKGDFFIIVSKLFQGSLQAQQQLRNQNSCDVNSSFDNIEGYSGVYASKSQYELASAADFDVFAQVFLLEIQTINDYKTNLANTP